MKYKMNVDLLSRAECNVLRGLAILGIFLHNYCHWLNPIVKENEYLFVRHNIDWMSQEMAHPTWLLPLHLLSYFGHYGVPVFLFLSAYGLERKYNNRLTVSSDATSLSGQLSDGSSHTPGVWAFIRYHYLKLFKMMIVGYVLFTIVNVMMPHPWHYNLIQIVAQLGMFNNLLPEPDRNIWPGPYWFFGLMLQFYIVYRVLLYRRHWGWTVGLMVLCLGIQLLLPQESEVLNRYRYNFMGGMLPFGLGLLFARYGERIIMVNLNLLGLLMSFVVTAMLAWTMSTNYVTWSILPAEICLVSVYFVKLLKVGLSHRWVASLYGVLEWMGKISAALFVIHPVIRKIFIPVSRYGDIYTGLLLYFIASIGVAWFIGELMKKIPNPKLKE